ncbi:hypothetical protein CBI38_28580 [Rhodococcus oxybenzonivorans]|uniref:Lipoprotein n=1 Tax=Rhodococcus oxybenzonivorans TaxID=1990687 RepID=A0A2S2C232_9NOCA|nr:hypothetical protein [Rhodococcus oxybenzonivorans]AWK74930.1 hypothetical protein CBI38_28580 [Rhodococcus oxybenzonivorans]
MRSARACGVAAALWVLVACGSGTDTKFGDTTTAPPEAAGAQDERDRAAEIARYNADLAAFVAAFRTRYPELASNRNDDSIAHIAIEPCIDLANGADEQTVTATITTQAENRGTLPTPEQAQQIYRLVEPICP